MDSSQDKSLPATERKLQKTRSDGQGARSRDLSHLAILGTGALMMLMGAEPLIQHLRMALAQQLAFDAHTAKTPALMMERMLSMGSMRSIIRAGRFPWSLPPWPRVRRWCRACWPAAGS